MFHTLAFAGSQTANAALLPLPPVPDQQIPQNQNSQFILPDNMQVLGVYCLGVGLGRSRLNTPSLRAIALPDVFPLTVAAASPSLPQIDYMYGAGPVLPKNDPLELDTSETTGANSTQWGLVWLADQRRQMPTGNSFKVFATSPGVAGGLFTWQAQALTLSTVLGAGTYAVVGLHCMAPALIAGRLVFVGGNLRPGVIGGGALGNYPNPLFTSGVLGEFGRFESNAQPAAEILAVGGIGTISWWLDLVKVA